jgi:hypothetical protein
MRDVRLVGCAEAEDGGEIYLHAVRGSGEIGGADAGGLMGDKLSFFVRKVAVSGLALPPVRPPRRASG